MSSVAFPANETEDSVDLHNPTTMISKQTHLRQRRTAEKLKKTSNSQQLQWNYYDAIESDLTPLTHFLRRRAFIE